MSSLERYIKDRYGFWVPFADVNDELLFDIEECLNLAVVSEKSIPNMEYRNAFGTRIYAENFTDKNRNAPTGGRVNPKLFETTFKHEEFALKSEDINLRDHSIKYTLLAKLLLLNLHLQSGETDEQAN